MDLPIPRIICRDDFSAIVIDRTFGVSGSVLNPMKFRNGIFVLFSFIVWLLPANGYAVEVDQSIEARAGAEINTTLGSRFLGELNYDLVLGKHWQISPGFLLEPGWSFLSAYHLEFGYQKLFHDALSIHVKFLNTAYHSYQVSENSIAPYLSLRTRNFEADLGLSLLFPSLDPNYLNLIFYYPAYLFQSFILFRVAGYLAWENPDLRIGLELKNLDYNYVRSSYNYSLHLDVIYHLAKSWSVRFNFGVEPSGINGLSLTFNRYLFYFGVRYWI